MHAGVHFAQIFGPYFSQRIVVGGSGPVFDANQPFFAETNNHLQATGDDQALDPGCNGGGADVVESAHMVSAP